MINKDICGICVPMERCPLTEDQCNRDACIRRTADGQDPICIDSVNLIREELVVSTVAQYLDPANREYYRQKYVSYTRLIQEIYDFSLDEFLLLLGRIGEDFDAREVVKKYLSSGGPTIPSKNN